MNDLIEIRVAGIPAIARLHTYTVVKPWRGSPHNCPSSMDYYGYSEMEYTICDRNGRDAPWLERKVDAEEREKIELQIHQYMEAVQ